MKRALQNFVAQMIIISELSRKIGTGYRVLLKINNYNGMKI